MRAVWAVALLLPLAGCLNDSEPIPQGSGRFDLLLRGDPTPVAFDDCAAALDLLNGRAARHANVSLAQSVEGIYPWIWFDGPVAAMEDGAAQAATSTGAPRAADAEVTGTNVQEAGVDEADILKTDGEWTYVLRQQTLFILHSETVGDLSEAHRIELEGHGRGLLLEKRDPDDPSDDRLLVITDGGYGEVMPLSRSASIAPDRYGWGMTHIITFGLQNRSAPTVLDDRWIEGSLSGARLVDGVAYVVVHEYEQDIGLRTWAWPEEDELQARGLSWDAFHRMDEAGQKAVRQSVADEAALDNTRILENATLDDHLPLIFRSTPMGLVPDVRTDADCRRILTTPDSTGRGTSTIVAMDLDRAGPAERTVQFLGSAPIVYGAQDALVFASASQDMWWFWAQPTLDEATDLHWFDLDGLFVTHRASGRVDGIVQDQFGIDVHDDQLRVATTTGTWGRWWLPAEEREPMSNHLAVFGEEDAALVEMGRVSGIAPDERLWSARFTDERAYLVTFEQIDPLWIIDLTDPTDPTILGELEIPGVSTYIHPINEDVLLTIGLGPGPGGQGLDWSRIQVSLFDISDPTDPTRADVIDVSPQGGWSWSNAVHEHKAFTYWDALGVLAVPVSTHHDDQGFDQHHIGLRLIDVDVEGLDLRIRGSVSHDGIVPLDRWGGDIERSYFLGFPETGPVSVYSLGTWSMASHDLTTLDLQDAVSLLGE